MQTQLVVLQGDITQLSVDTIVGNEHLANDLQSTLLETAYRNALLRAKSDRARSVAFPCVGSGVKDYPRSEAVEVALKTVRDFISEHPGTFTEIIFACWDTENYHLYKQMLGGENRVIGAQRDLVGYGGGLWRKRWLLEHENKFAHGVQTLF